MLWSTEELHSQFSSEGVKCGELSQTNLGFNSEVKWPLYLSFLICTRGTIAPTAKICEN